MPFLIYFFPFVFKFLFLTFAYEIEISRSSYREEFLIITVPVTQGHFLSNLFNQGPATLLKISFLHKYFYGKSDLYFSNPSCFLIILETLVFNNCLQSFSGCFWNLNQMMNLIVSDEFNFWWGLQTTVWNSGYYDNAGSIHLEHFCWIHVLKGYSKFCNISRESFHLKLKFPNN